MAGEQTGRVSHARPLPPSRRIFCEQQSGRSPAPIAGFGSRHDACEAAAGVGTTSSTASTSSVAVLAIATIMCWAESQRTLLLGLLLHICLVPTVLQGCPGRRRHAASVVIAAVGRRQRLLHRALVDVGGLTSRRVSNLGLRRSNRSLGRGRRVFGLHLRCSLPSNAPEAPSNNRERRTPVEGRVEDTAAAADSATALSEFELGSPPTYTMDVGGGMGRGTSAARHRFFGVVKRPHQPWPGRRHAAGARATSEEEWGADYSGGKGRRHLVRGRLASLSASTGDGFLIVPEQIRSQSSRSGHPGEMERSASPQEIQTNNMILRAVRACSGNTDGTRGP